MGSDGIGMANKNIGQIPRREYLEKLTSQLSHRGAGKTAFLEMPEDVSREALQQNVYNLILYLPLKELDVRNGMSIKNIIETANKKQGKIAIDKGVLETLNRALHDETGYPELGMVKINNLSYDENTYKVCRGTSMKKEHLEIVRERKAFLAATFTLDAINSGYFRSGQSLVCRGTPERAWMDNPDMLMNGTGSVTIDGKTWGGISEIDEAMISYYQMLRNSPAPVLDLGNMTTSGHSKGGHQSGLLKLLFPEDFKKSYMLDAPGYSKRLWAELEEQYGVRGLNRIRDEMIAIHLENDYVHVLGWTKDREYMAKSVFALKSDISLENIMDEHYPEKLLHIQSGKLRLKEVSPDKDGYIAEYLKSVSDEMLKMPEEDGNLAGKIIMQSVIDGFGYGEQVNFGAEEKEEFERHKVRGYFNLGLAMVGAMVGLDVNLTEEESEELRGFVGKRIRIIGFELVEYISTTKDKISEMGEVVVHASKISLSMMERMSKNEWKNTDSMMTTLLLCGINSALTIGSKVEDRAKRIRNKVDRVNLKHLKRKKKLRSSFVKSLEQTITNLEEMVKEWMRDSWDKERDVLDKNTVSFEKLPSPVKRTVQCIQQYYNVEHTAQLSRIMKMVEYVRLSVTNECFVTAVKDMQRRELEEFHNNAAASKTLSVREKINTLYENVNIALDRVKASLARVLSALESGKAALGLGFGFSQVCTCILLASRNRTVLQTQKSVISFGKFGMNYEKMEQLQERISMYCEESLQLEREINDIISDVKSLQYVSVSTSGLLHAKTGLVKRRESYAGYGYGLAGYVNTAKNTEERFLSAMRGIVPV